ncbi:hypothetical protein [Mycolicibacterium thermoresistibile]|jgi:hypothetical protein|nr:hypothetical protein [Mycolicibacterium thermoresistibile]MCV7190252.1 hypothetical protein [Mycolicibacterium thermoresistibile]GAT13687.1 putative uncharacterized protein [Mycolicibacterium thermoresistibile]
MNLKKIAAGGAMAGALAFGALGFGAGAAQAGPHPHWPWPNPPGPGILPPPGHIGHITGVPPGHWHVGPVKINPGWVNHL